MPKAPPSSADAERAADQRFRENLAARGFDPSMADWILTWDEDADGQMVPGSTGLIKPDNDNG